jgi:hypothetical protein
MYVRMKDLSFFKKETKLCVIEFYLITHQMFCLKDWFTVYVRKVQDNILNVNYLRKLKTRTDMYLVLQCSFSFLTLSLKKVYFANDYIPFYPVVYVIHVHIR